MTMVVTPNLIYKHDNSECVQVLKTLNELMMGLEFLRTDDVPYEAEIFITDADSYRLIKAIW